MAKTSRIWDNALAGFQPLITALGEVGYAYNLLQESFYNLFALMMAVERPSPAPLSHQAKFQAFSLAMWHVLQSDRLQRDLAMAALENLPTNMDIGGGITRLKWAKKQADKIGDYRNIIVHTPMKLWFPIKNTGEISNIPIPSFGGTSTRPINIHRLRQIKSVRFWKAIRNDLLNLNDYVDFVGRQIAWREYERQNGAPVPGALRAWPRKPRLPSVRRIEKIDQTAKALLAPPQPPKRRKRPRPSGGASPTKTSSS